MYFLIFILFELSISRGRHSRRHRYHRSRRHSALNDIMEVDLRIPYKRSWYFGKPRKPPNHELIEGIKKVQQKITQDRMKKDLFADVMAPAVDEIVKHFGGMTDSFLGKKIKQRDHEVLLKDSMDEAMIYALSVLHNRREVEKATKELKAQQKKEYDHKMKEYEEEKKYKKELQKQQMDMQKDVMKSQTDLMAKQMDTQAKAMAPKKKFLGIF